jgi:hypothetical protein
MSILLRRLSAACTLLAVMACLPQGSLMLCSVEGGGVAIEAAHGDDSAFTHAERSAAPADGECDCDGDCGPCRDSKVGAELTPGRVRDEASAGAGALVSPLLLPFATVAPSPAAPPALARIATAPPRPPARIAAGVQLRI